MKTFEESIDEINNEINKRRSKWNLSILAWMDFDDVAQILRIHIWKKWHLYNQVSPLPRWVNTIISNQIKNIRRNTHGNYVRPCLKCDAAEGENLCRIYTKQCDACPLYAHWEKTKKHAHDIKLPVSLENHSQEVFNVMKDSVDIERSAENLHAYMEKALKPTEWKVYKYLYIENKSDDDVAALMDYTTSEKNRSPGYKRLKNIKKSIIIQAKKCLFEGKVDII